MTAGDIVSFLLPHIATAGRYAGRIQKRIQARPAKSGDTAFQQALTDADLSVQAFLEVALLSRFPDVVFYSEEQADSLNAKYFPPRAQFEILVDPIDGTRAYLDGAEAFQIIVTIREHRTIAAVVCFMPRHDRCFLAIRNKLAIACSLAQMEKGSLDGERIQLSDESRRIVLFNAPSIKSALDGHFDVIDIVEEYTNRGVHHGFTEILTGKAAACIHPRPQLIDASAIAFIAREAGGVLTSFDGDSLNFDHAPDERGPSLVVSASPAFHKELLARLKTA